MSNSRNFNSSKAASTKKPSVVFQAETPKEAAKRKINDTVRRDAGKYLSFATTGISGLFVGACTYETWPCFIIIDKDRNVHFVKSIETFKVEKEVPACFSILEYLREHQEDFLKELVDETLKSKGLEPIGNIVIVRRKTQPKKQFNKNKKK